MGVLDGKVAVVTGGAGLLGTEYSRLLAKYGAKVLINDTNPDAADKLVKEITKAGGTASAFIGGVESWEKAGRIIDACVQKYGRIDCLVNSAHKTAAKPIWELSEEELDVSLNIHLKGHFACAHHASKHMVKQKSGSIVTVSSRALTGHPGLSPYAAVKGGIVSATFSWALELAAHGVRVNCINPAAVRPKEGEPEVKHMQWHWDFRLDRMSWYAPVPGPKSVAPLIVYLVSDASKWVTGQVIFLSGDTLAIMRHPKEEKFAFMPNGWSFEDIERYFKETIGATLEKPGMGAGQYAWYEGVR